MATAGGVTSIDINLIHRLTNLTEIQRHLHEVISKERAIDSELDRLLSKRAELERSFLLLNTPTAETLELVHADCEQLLSSAQGTAQLASNISSKVRRLDTAQTRVNDVLGQINLILDRTAAINGVTAALEAEDYEAAAGHVATFMTLEATLGGSALTGLDAGQVESQRQVLLDAKAQLERVVSARLDEAVARRDVAAAARFSKLLKPLGQPEEGLRRFTEFLRLLVAGQAQTHYNTVSEQADSAARIDWSAALAGLFKEVCMVVEEHGPLVQEQWGPSGMLEVVGGLQAECDTAGSRLLGRYLEARRVTQVVRDATGRRGKGADGAAAGASSGAGSGVDHKAIESHITELLSLCRLAEEYNQFMLGHMRVAAGGGLSAAREATFRSGPLNVRVRELLGAYMSLEEVYMGECASMAIRIDEVVPGSLTSSLVDDVFFVLRKSAVRALASSNVQVISALVMEANNVVGNQLRNALAARLASGPARLLAAAPAAADGGIPPPASGAPAPLSSLPPQSGEAAVGLNNSDVAAEYVAKLKGELEGYLPDLFPGSPTAPADRERVRGVLGELARTAAELRHAHTKAVDALAEGLVPRLRPVLDDVAAASYVLSESDYAALEGGEGWAGRLLLALQANLGWMSGCLTTNNYEGVVHGVLDRVVSRLEAVLARKQFNQLGGLQLERDTRTLVSHLSELTTRAVRDKFARLNQMALLLGLEAVAEVNDYWGGDAAIAWRMTAAEVRATLSQRPDFPREAIAALHLP
uniref:Conserved oligomeric Golgi complex subunit 4 n=1 Tax=Chlamydomonas leiostraca TaxID=1034604 RepID=A0A7S0RYR1_9CHLO|mmetsp:Transcript_35340/g.89472  ORF Transcript_35340/g.89472 Transcript_35340/m.89472 type:complete len:758 (+) Transcript_35340:69-2342(+)